MTAPLSILLVQPWEKRHRRYRSALSMLLAYPPLTLPLLAALVPEELEAKAEVFDEMHEKELPAKHYDVVAITCITSEAPRAYELAAHFKQQGSWVVLGGYHPTLMPEEALEHADSVVVGEAELAWPQLLVDVSAGRPKRLYQQKPQDLACVPAAERSILRSRRYSPLSTINASRGCTHNCEFCSITRLAGCNSRPLQQVVDELAKLKHRSVIFFDPDFFMNRSYALALMEQLQTMKLRWAACATLELARDPELLEAAARSGCTAVLIGFETITPTRGLDKPHDPAEYAEAIATIQAQGININGTFMLGLDNDTEESLSALPAAVRKLGLDLALFFTLTPYPGTPLFERLDREGRILTRDWSHYTQADVVFQPAHLTPQRLLELYEHCWDETYRMGNLVKRVRASKGKSLWARAAMLAVNIGFKYVGRDL